MRVDLSGVEVKDSEFGLVDSGTYNVKVTDGQIKDNKDGPSAKNPTGQHIHWEFTIQDPGKFEGWKQWKNTPLGGDGLGILKELLMASGRFTEDQVNGDLDFEVEDLIGADVVITVQQKKRSDNGEMANNVGKVKPAGEATGATSLLP